jgi:hypothetical protein
MALRAVFTRFRAESAALRTGVLLVLERPERGLEVLEVVERDEPVRLLWPRRDPLRRGPLLWLLVVRDFERAPRELPFADLLDAARIEELDRGRLFVGDDFLA